MSLPSFSMSWFGTTTLGPPLKDSRICSSICMAYKRMLEAKTAARVASDRVQKRLLEGMAVV